MKANRPELHAMVQAYFADPEIRRELATAETVDADHGRVEERRAFVCHDLTWLRGPKKAASTDPVLLPDMACLAMIEARVERNGKTALTRQYHVSSRPLEPKAYLEAARAHWAIENGLHWVLDVTFDEDRARNRKDHGPENLATLRKLALNVLNRSMSSIAPGPISPPDKNENEPVGQTTSPDPSSVKCDNPGNESAHNNNIKRRQV